MSNDGDARRRTRLPSCRIVDGISRRVRALTLSLLMVSACDCEASETAEQRASPMGEAVQQEPVRDEALIAEGRELVLHFQCNRCHVIEGIDAPPTSQRCVGCHQDIRSGEFSAEAEDLARWTLHIRGLTDSPTLVSVGPRLRPEWLAAFLLDPQDLRPGLEAMMPRLAIEADQAAAIAAFLTRDAAALGEPPAEDHVVRGRRLFDERGCRACHGFSDAEAPERAERADTGSDTDAALAPNLDVTRDRFVRENITAWIQHPSHMKSDTVMPELGLSGEDAEALASYILFAELAPPSPPALVPQLPVLTREVLFAEVDERVFHRICRHCHADGDFALGDGGPGNDGGFGFEGRGLNLTNYEGMAAGLLVDGRRESVFAVDESGMPRLVRALRARQLEEAGLRDPDVRGMPLGHPALSAEDLQLVATWVSQGRRR